jgi:hypothetical protein
MALDVSPPPARLLQWCQRRLGQLTENGAIVRVELWHERDGGSPTRIDTIHTRDGATPDDVAQQLADAARSEAEASLTAGALRFEAAMFDSTDERARPVSQLPFLVDAIPRTPRFGEAPPNRGGHASATDQGITALVRASVETQRLFVEKFDNILQTQARQVEILSARNQELMSANFSAAEVLSRIMGDQRREEAELVKVQFGERRKQQVFETAMGFVPLLLAQATKGSGAAAALASKSDDPLRVALRGFLQGINEEQFTAIMGALPPEKQALLGQVAMIVSEDLEKLEQKLPPEPETKP